MFLYLTLNSQTTKKSRFIKRFVSGKDSSFDNVSTEVMNVRNVHEWIS